MGSIDDATVDVIFPSIIQQLVWLGNAQFKMVLGLGEIRVRDLILNAELKWTLAFTFYTSAVCGYCA